MYIGNDSGSPLTAIQNDILEMAESGADLTHMKVVLFNDFELIGDSYLAVLDTVLDMEFRKIPLAKAGIPMIAPNEADCSDTAVLAAVIDYAQTYLPSENYALVTGAHGTGFSSSRESGLILDLDGVQEVTPLNDIADAIKPKGIDVFIMDNCLMGTVESIYQLRDSVDYVVASPAQVPGSGHDYSILLNTLYKNTSTPEEFTKAAVQSYYEAYKDLTTPVDYVYTPPGQRTYNKELIMGYRMADFRTATTTPAPGELIYELNVLFAEMNSKYTTLDYYNITWNPLGYYESTKYFIFDTLYSSHQYIDLKNFLLNYPSDSAKTAEVIAMLDNAIIKADGTDRSFLSIYFPFNWEPSSLYATEPNDFINHADNWKLLLQ